MDENQNNDINNDMNDVQESEGVLEETNENMNLEEKLQSDGGLSDILGLVPGLGVRNIVVQSPVEQEDTPVESVVETSTEVMDSMEEDTESYMDDDAV
jgi:hypothetical protein